MRHTRRASRRVASASWPGTLFDANAIGDYAKDRLAAFKYPRFVKIMAEFPLGPSGKVLKRALVTRYAQE